MREEKDFITKDVLRKDRPGQVNRRKLFRFQCDSCGKDLGYKRKSSTVTSCKDCKIYKLHKKILPQRQSVCPRCDIKFETHQYNKRFCSKKCKNANMREKRRATPQGKLRHRVSSLMSTRLRNQQLNKNNKNTFEVLPYTLEELRIHLEIQFEPWMTWDNYGLKGWTIDHIIPESHFNYNSIDSLEFKKCWELTNLRPLRHRGPNGNAAKGNKVKGHIWRF